MIADYLKFELFLIGYLWEATKPLITEVWSR